MDFLEEIRVSSVVSFGCFGEFLFCICVMLYVVVYVILFYVCPLWDTYYYLKVFLYFKYDSFQHAYQFMVVRFSVSVWIWS